MHESIKMATVELTVGSGTAPATDIGTIWKAAIDRYEEITMVKIEALARANNMDEILLEIQGRETKFLSYRHNGSRIEKLRSLMSRTLNPVGKLSNIVASAASTVMHPF